MLQGLLWRCMCVCVSIRSAFPLYLKVLYDTLGSQRCSRDCSGVLVMASLEETQGGALAGWRWHHSRRREGCSGGLAVTSLKETWGLLSRFVCVYSDYITQGCPGGALAGSYEPTCQVLLFSYTPGILISVEAGCEDFRLLAALFPAFNKGCPAAILTGPFTTRTHLLNR